MLQKHLEGAGMSAATATACFQALIQADLVSLTGLVKQSITDEEVGKVCAHASLTAEARGELAQHQEKVWFERSHTRSVATRDQRSEHLARLHAHMHQAPQHACFAFRCARLSVSVFTAICTAC